MEILIGCQGGGGGGAQRSGRDEDPVGIGAAAAAAEIFLNEMSTRSVRRNNRADRVCVERRWPRRYCDGGGGGSRSAGEKRYSTHTRPKTMLPAGNV